MSMRSRLAGLLVVVGAGVSLVATGAGAAPVALVSISPPAICADPWQSTTFSLDGSASTSGAPILLWIWSASFGTVIGSGAQATLSLPPGFTGCVDVTLQVVDANDEQDAATAAACVYPTPIATIAPIPLVCAQPGSPTRVTLDGSGSTGIASLLGWQWSTSHGTISGSGSVVELTLPGSFAGCATVTLVVTDANGCSDQATTQVCVSSSPLADAGPDRSVCPGDEVMLGTPALPGHTYAWTPAVGLDDPGVATPRATFTSAVTYTLAVTGPGGCTAQATVDLTGLPAGTRDAMANALRSARRDVDVEHSWQLLSGGVRVYRIEAGDRRDLADALPVGDTSLDRLVDVGGILSGSSVRYYTLSATGCV